MPATTAISSSSRGAQSDPAGWGWSEVVVEAFRDHSVLGGAPYLWFTGIAVALASTVALAVVAMAGAASRSAGS